MDVRESDVAKTVGDVCGSANRRDFHVPVAVVNHQVALHVARIHASKRSRDVPGSRVGKRDRSVAPRDGCSALDIFRGDAPEAVAHFKRSFYVGHQHATVRVRYRHVSSSASQLNAPERIVYTRGPYIAH